MSLQTLYFGVAHAFILALGFILMCRNIQECKRLWIYQKEYSVSELLFLKKTHRKHRFQIS